MLTLLGLAFGTDLTLKLANVNGIVVVWPQSWMKGEGPL